ncbi:hypothetical protein CMUS01_12106 [Colletotrichum musicola]|uniref:RNase H type-1 domain-containing protein n=1 Tax=Colletotrichum musicola TaxID=2175873 RepID=A0A8H6JQQ1_9PEZI|nr:hypothetical protein CMUS01_12106 [Colletotrichum musicola]
MQGSKRKANGKKASGRKAEERAYSHTEYLQSNTGRGMEIDLVIPGGLDRLNARHCKGLEILICGLIYLYGQQVALEGARLRFATQYSPRPLDPIVQQEKEEAAKAFLVWLKTIPDNHMVIYSDGSKASNGATGYGFVIYRGTKRIAQGCGRFSLAEVFDGEVEGARAGLRRALLTSQGRPIHICIDNTSVIQGIRGEAPDSSQAAFLEIQEAARIFDIQTHWAPGHQGIRGNEEADRLSKQGTTLPVPLGQRATLAGIKRLAKKQIQSKHARW